MTPQERVINTSERTEGMVDASASYYQESKLFHAIQNTQALEYDSVHEADLDLALQLSPLTATWGLTYWEGANGLRQNPLDGYEKRRPSILASMARDQNFSAPMVYHLAKSFGEEIHVEIDPVRSLVLIAFQHGVPALLREFRDALENVIHAHLEYRITCCFPVLAKNKHGFYCKRLHYALSVGGYHAGVIQLDGEKLLGGTWWLNQKSSSGFTISGAVFSFGNMVKNKNKLAIHVALADKRSPNCGTIGVTYRLRKSNIRGPALLHMNCGVSVRQRYASMVFIT